MASSKARRRAQAILSSRSSGSESGVSMATGWPPLASAARPTRTRQARHSFVIFTLSPRVLMVTPPLLAGVMSLVSTCSSLVAAMPKSSGERTPLSSRPLAVILGDAVLRCKLLQLGRDSCHDLGGRGRVKARQLARDSLFEPRATDGGAACLDHIKHTTLQGPFNKITTSK